VRNTMQRHFGGAATFRVNQEKWFRAVMTPGPHGDLEDVILIAPTGAGKSILYQVCGIALRSTGHHWLRAA
jgi:superfamily II DNA helicase RecQ